MKIRKNARDGAIIIIIISIVALILLLVIETVPDVDVNKLTITEKTYYNLGVYKVKEPIWKIIGFIIVILLIIACSIINYIMCRCNYCGKHIHFMNIHLTFCPYCSKSLYPTKEEVLKEKENTSMNNKEEKL